MAVCTIVTKRFDTYTYYARRLATFFIKQWIISDKDIFPFKVYFLERAPFLYHDLMHISRGSCSDHSTLIHTALNDQALQDFDFIPNV